MPELACKREDVKTIDVGKWTRHHTQLLLHTRDPETGKVVTSFRNATPLGMSAVLLGLLAQLEEIKLVVAQVPASEQKDKIETELMGWEQRLGAYFEYTNAAIAEDPTDPSRIYYCVTAPLLLGWFPNADCTDVNPSQVSQSRLDIASPIIILNQALCAGAFFDTQGFGQYWEYVGETAKDVGDLGAEVWEGAKDLAERAYANVNEYISVQKKLIPWALGAAAIAGLAYLAFMYGPKRRRT